MCRNGIMEWVATAFAREGIEPSVNRPILLNGWFSGRDENNALDLPGIDHGSQSGGLR